MINVLYRGSCSACFEMDDDSPYYSEDSYEVILNGSESFRGNTNVFSLYGLAPGTDYEALVRFGKGNEERVRFTTRPESCCLSVRDFGAVGDGVHEDTAAIQAAVNFLPEGGRLMFPAGTYLTLPLSLKSHITLELCEGATILGSTDRKRYPVMPGVSKDAVTGKDFTMAVFEGGEKAAYQSLIQAAYAGDISIVGKGAIDGNGQNGDWWRGFESFPASRPRVIFLNHCEGVTLHGITVKNGPSWHIHPFFSRDVSVLDCYVTAPRVSPNTDGIEPESCEGVNIIGCHFSVGDDCVAIKSGKIEMARKYEAPADRNTIRDCLMEYGHGGVTLGSELSAGITNLSVTKCFFHETDRGLRIKTRRGRGKDALVDGVLFANIRMVGVLTPIVINMWYGCCDPDREDEYVWSRESLPVDERTPRLGSFTFRDLDCSDAEVAACYIDGLPESPIGEVDFENVRVTFAEDAKPGYPAMMNFPKECCRTGLYLENVSKIAIKNVSLANVSGEAVIAANCGEVEMEGFEAD